ncbi:alpha/beta hydrolase [Limosilactobacillus agrestis]|uniref:Alpha/beta hydrolase n=1 Tax=Limosilactobacillus agrestis TaxID=2759748 RepID=A0ABS8RAT2_9LACO|nr:alpha/beta hydrolase [Limosilactobacillus agrestis]MCD7126711.1 alpha/beta hydrolase [Limosilactobacillus agrestis]MCD7130981.1 alpha/beta hydrolase [Limosilactobacillus agrestis]
MFFEYASDMKLHYDIRGDGTPVLLIHGLGCDMNLMIDAFEPIFTNETRNYKRIYVDLPGMGESSKTLTYASSDKILTILEKFVDKIIGKEHFLLVGQSFGGYLSRGLLAHYRFQVNGLTLLCPVIIPTSADRDLPQQYLSFADEKYLKTFDQKLAKLIKENLIIANKQTIERQQKEVLSGLAKADQQFLKALQKDYTFSTNVDEVIAAMNYDKPSLILTGHQDTRVGYKDQWKLFELFPRATFTVLDVADHSLQIEEPTVFNVLVKNWLNRLVKFA